MKCAMSSILVPGSARNCGEDHEPELAVSLLEGTIMMRTALVALMTIAFLGANVVLIDLLKAD